MEVSGSHHGRSNHPEAESGGDSHVVGCNPEEAGDRAGRSTGLVADTHHGGNAVGIESDSDRCEERLAEAVVYVRR